MPNKELTYVAETAHGRFTPVQSDTRILTPTQKTSRIQNLLHQIINSVAPNTIFPLAPIPNTPNFAPNPNRSTRSYTRSFTPLNTLSQQIHSLAAHIADTRVQLFKINSVLQSTALYVFPLRNFAVGG